MSDATITEVAEAFEEFKRANDLKLKKVEKGVHVAEDLTAKVEGLNEAIENGLKSFEEKDAEAKALKARTDALEATIKRLNSSAQSGVQIEAKHISEYKAMYGDEAGAEEFGEHRKAFQAFMRKGRDDALHAIQQKAMSVDSDEDGGYWVLPDTSGRMVSKVFESSPMRQAASVQAISTDSLEGTYDLDEAGSGWVAERGSRAETDTPVLGQWKIPVHEMYAEPRATQKLLDDAMVNPETWLADKVSAKFGRDEATAFVNGDGVGKPRGILTYDHGTPTGTSKAAWQVIERTPTGVSGDWAASNEADVFLTTMGTMKDVYLNGASWAMNRTVRAATRKLKDGNGQYLLAMDFTNGPSTSLLGLPVLSFEDMPAIAANSLSIALANFSAAYQIVDRIGIRVLRDPYTSKPYVKFYTTRRVGGDVLNFEAIKLIRFAAAAS